MWTVSYIPLQLPGPAFLIPASLFLFIAFGVAHIFGKKFFQSTEAELICTTAYLSLFLRNISEPALLATFLRFIFVDTCDDRSIIDTLIVRIGSQTKVSSI